jgi:chromosome segregation ATPase
MYEPYGEGKKFNINIEGLKEKIRNLKNIKFNKTLAIIVAVIAIAAVGSVTGYVSYTGKMTEFTSQITILERQMDACQNNVSSCLVDLSSTKDTLGITQTEKQKCLIDLECSKTDTEKCISEKGNLSGTLTEMESTIGEWETKYDHLSSNYEDLQNKQSVMEENYAKGCCTFGYSYYFLKDGTKVVCCLKQDVNYCSETPASADMIKKLSC